MEVKLRLSLLQNEGELLQELPSEDPDVKDKPRVCLLQEQGDLDEELPCEDPGVEDVIETSRETQMTVVLVL